LRCFFISVRAAPLDVLYNLNKENKQIQQQILHFEKSIIYLLSVMQQQVRLDVLYFCKKTCLCKLWFYWWQINWLSR